MSGKQSKAARRAAATPQYWHGGAPGRSVGDVLLSRAAAEAQGLQTMHHLQGGYAEGITDPTHVYFTTSREFGRAWAAGFQRRDDVTGIVFERGTLYRVEPDGPVVEDPDFRGHGICWAAQSARVVAVEEEGVFLEPTDIAARTGPYQAWSSGHPIYDRAGGVVPYPDVVRSPQALYPPWTPREAIIADRIGRPDPDRPDPATAPGIAWPATSMVAVHRTHLARATQLLSIPLDFRRPRSATDIEAVNSLLEEAGCHAGLTLAQETRGVCLAVHPTQGIVGAVVMEASNFEGRPYAFVSAVAVRPDWRRRGVASVLLNTSHQLLPQPPQFMAGHCDPAVAPFFAQAGFTVLRPGVDLVLPLKEPTDLRTEGDVWFYRQSIR